MYIWKYHNKNIQTITLGVRLFSRKDYSIRNGFNIGSKKVLISLEMNEPVKKTKEELVRIERKPCGFRARESYEKMPATCLKLLRAQVKQVAMRALW